MSALSSEHIFFGSFIVVIIVLLLIDLGVFNRKSHIIPFKEALFWTLLWISLAIGFYFFLLFKGEIIHGVESLSQLKELAKEHHPSLHESILESKNFDYAIKAYRNNLSLEFITGYLIEYALSIDNIFVIILIFMAFGIHQKHYKWVLFWGIFGAIVMRFIFIFLSSALIHRFEWVLYVFGAFLLFTGIMMFLKRNKESRIEPQNHPVVKIASRYFRVFPRMIGHTFFFRHKRNKKIYITPLFLVLLVIEFSDVLFAVDSVPAIFSITKDPYIVFFSNIFAICGLRSLFFLIMNMMNKFKYLKHGLSFLMLFIGAKMMLHTWLEDIGFTTLHSLIVVAGILTVSMLISVFSNTKKKA